MTVSIEQLRRENDTLKSDNTQLRTDNDAMDNENKELTTLVHEVTITNENQRQQINSRDREIEELTDENRQLKIEVQQLKVS